jgi:hypothetical protein
MPGTVVAFKQDFGIRIADVDYERTQVEELLERKSSGSFLENLYYDCKGSALLTTQHPSICKSWHYG